MFRKSVWHNRDLKSECWISRHIIIKKILNFFIVWRLEFFVEKWNMYEAHIFPRPFQLKCRMETTPLCFNTRICVNKKFKIHINIIEINVNVCLLCAPNVMSSIILHTRRPVNKKSVTHLVFIFRLTFIFRILRSWKARFSIHSLSTNELCTNEIKVVGVQ
jgi:hypothetical protein